MGREKSLEIPIRVIHFGGLVRWIGYPLMFLAVFVLVGGHWAVLQTVAWAGMMRDYSQNNGLLSGLEKTFNGENPCDLCVKVQEGKEQEEEKQPLSKAEKKAEVWLEPVCFQFLIFSKPAAPWAGFAAEKVLSRRDAPSSPPPRWIS